jgi:hypothetical protein
MMNAGFFALRELPSDDVGTLEHDGTV